MENTNGTNNNEQQPPPNGPVGSLTGNYTKDLDSINLIHQKGTEPLIIQLRSSDGQTVMDSLDASYEDSFCLDSFKDLTLAHQEAGKYFIIARVQTWDRKQPEKAYYSYYNAYHLNKILFQTQWFCGKRLIHRLLVLNPLTNSDIVGDVQYFMVRTKAMSESDNVSEIPTDSPLKSTVISPFSVQKPVNDSPTSRNHRRRSTATDTKMRVSFYMKKSLPPKFTPSTTLHTNETKEFDRDNLFIGSSVIEGKRQRTASLPAKFSQQKPFQRTTSFGSKVYAAVLKNQDLEMGPIGSGGGGGMKSIGEEDENGKRFILNM